MTRANNRSGICPVCQDQMILTDDGYMGSKRAHGGAGSAGLANHHQVWLCSTCEEKKPQSKCYLCGNADDLHREYDSVEDDEGAWTCPGCCDC